MFQVTRKRFMMWFWMLLVIMLLQIATLYIASETQKKDLYNGSVDAELGRSVIELNNYFETVKSVAISLSLDGETISAFSKPMLNPIEQQALSLKLKQYKAMTSCISSIYLYNPDNNIVYSDVYMCVPLEKYPFPKTQEHIQKMLESSERYFVFSDSPSEVGWGGEVIRSGWRFKKHEDYLILIDLNYDLLKATLDLSEECLGGHLYMLDEDGDLLCKGSGTENLLKTLTGTEQEVEKLEKSRQDKKMLVKKYAVNQARASLFYTIELSEIKMDNLETRTLVIINVVMISVILLLVGVVSLFQGMRSIVKKNAEFAERKAKKEHFAEKRQGIINCLTHSENTDTEAAKNYIKAELARADFNEVALFRLDIHGYNEEQYTEKMKLLQQWERILGEFLPALSAYEQDGYVVFLIADGGINYVDSCRRAYAACRQASLEQMNAELSGYVSSASVIERLAETYTELCNIVEYQFIYHRPIFLDYTILWKRKDEREQWNHFKIEMICNNIIAPRQDVVSLIDEFISDLRSLSIEKVKSALYELFIEVCKAVSAIEKEENLKTNFDACAYLSELSSLEYLDAANELFERIIGVVKHECSTDAGGKHDIVVKRALKIIQERVQDPGLCRGMIADEIGISQSYLSRIFKDKVGVSLSDMINEAKLKIVEEQLRNTNKSIKEIIESVGIVNQSYFTVMFKKKYGILPTEYRNRKGEAGGE